MPSRSAWLWPFGLTCVGLLVVGLGITFGRITSGWTLLTVASGGALAFFGGRWLLRYLGRQVERAGIPRWVALWILLGLLALLPLACLLRR